MANPLPIVPDSDIVVRIRGGEEAAFEQLFLEHYKRLCLLAERIMGSSAAAEELVQDVLLRVWEHRKTWTITSSVGGYLTAAVRNHALNRLQRERAERRWSDRVQHYGNPVIALHGQHERPDDAVAGLDLSAAIERAITQLPPRCREVFVLRRQRQLSYAEIAHVMGISPKTVEIQMGLALKALRKHLSAWLD